MFFISFFQPGALSKSRNRPSGKIIDCFILAVWWCFFFYLEGMQLLLLWGEALLLHLYASVCSICKGSIICLYWYVRSVLRFPLNYSEPHELSCTICVSLHNVQQNSPHFVLLSCKIEAFPEVVCEFLGSFSSRSLHMDSREMGSEVRNMVEFAGQRLTDFLFSNLQPKMNKPTEEEVKGSVRVSWNVVVSNWTNRDLLYR